jgi:putative flippase GtrA
MMRVMLGQDVRTFARFAAVGIASNALLYLLYLVLAAGVGVRPVLALFSHDVGYKEEPITG